MGAPAKQGVKRGRKTGRPHAAHPFHQRLAGKRKQGAIRASYAGKRKQGAIRASYPSPYKPRHFHTTHRRHTHRHTDAHRHIPTHTRPRTQTRIDTHRRKQTHRATIAPAGICSKAVRMSTGPCPRRWERRTYSRNARWAWVKVLQDQGSRLPFKRTLLLGQGEVANNAVNTTARSHGNTQPQQPHSDAAGKGKEPGGVAG
jgi:hypothetical protein